MNNELQKVVKQGDTLMLSKLLDQHPEWTQSVTSQNENLVVLATRYQQPACLKLCLEKGISARIPNEYQVTALMIVAGEKTEESRLCFNQLLSCSDLDAQDRDGWTALYWATNEKNATAVEALLKAGANAALGTKEKRTPLMSAAESLDNSLLLMLLPVGEVDAQDDLGYTALMHAIIDGSGFAIERLAAQSTLTQRNKEKETALHLAIRRLLKSQEELFYNQKKVNEKGVHLDILAQHMNPQHVLEIVDETRADLKGSPFIRSLIEHDRLRQSLESNALLSLANEATPLTAPSPLRGRVGRRL